MDVRVPTYAFYDPPDCLEILAKGLPESSRPPGSVVVVGAGIAGLTAGLLLKNAGHQVTILEAQNRVGGRILTDRGFAGDMYAELGAMRFPAQHPLVQYLIHEKFKLDTSPFPMVAGDTLIHLHGRSVRRSEFEVDMFNFRLPASERHRTPDDIVLDALRPLLAIMDKDDKEAAWEEVLEQYDSYSLLGYLKHQGLSGEAISLIGPLLNLEGRYHYSLVEWFSHFYEDVFGELEFISDGADLLPRAFEPYLMDNIRFGARVRAVEQLETRVRVHFRSTGMNQNVSASECILTVPFSLLRHMEISGLDPAKWVAIRNSYYGRAHKIFMQFSDRWWESKYGITHGMTVTDLPIRNVVYTPAGQDYRYKKGVLIASYAWEQDSLAYAPLSDADRIELALEDLAKIHPEAEHTFEFGVSKDWAMDPYAGGIGPLFRPFEMTGRFYEDVIRPVHRVWFAGDVCDRRHRRWVEGSLRSAIKNAYALHLGIRNEMPWKD